MSIALKDSTGKVQTFSKLNLFASGLDGYVYKAAREADNKSAIIKMTKLAAEDAVRNLRQEVKVYRDINGFYRKESDRRHPLRDIYDIHDRTNPISKKKLTPDLYASGTTTFCGESVYAIALSKERPMPWKHGEFDRFIKDERPRWITIFAHLAVSRIQYFHCAGYSHCDLHDQNFCWRSRGKKRHDLIIIDLSRAQRWSGAKKDETVSTYSFESVSRSADLFRFSCALAGIAAGKTCPVHKASSRHQRDMLIGSIMDKIIQKALTSFVQYIDGLCGADAPDYDHMRRIWKGAHDNLATKGQRRLALFTHDGRKKSKDFTDLTFG